MWCNTLFSLGTFLAYTCFICFQDFLELELVLNFLVFFPNLFKDLALSFFFSFFSNFFFLFFLFVFFSLADANLWLFEGDFIFFLIWLIFCLSLLISDALKFFFFLDNF